jgi:ribosomal protein L7/L12
MKINISRKELLSILTKHFGEEVTECVIAKTNYLAEVLQNAMSKHFNCPIDCIAGLTHSTDKISAIKYLREIEPKFGLFTAKAFIENWDKFIDMTRKLGRYPKVMNDPNDLSKLLFS